MNAKPEIIIVGLFAIFTILLFGYSFTGYEILNTLLMWYLIIISLIFIVYLLIKLLKTPKEGIISNFKKQHIIIKVLSLITIISIVGDLVLNQINFSPYLVFLLVIVIYWKWI